MIAGMSRDLTTVGYFNQAGIKLILDTSVGADEFVILRDSASLARLTGAPDNSVINVAYNTTSRDSLNLIVNNPKCFQYPSEYVLFREGNGAAMSLYIDSIYVHHAMRGAGLGTRSVMTSIAEAKNIGLTRIVLHAAGSAISRQTFVGYYVWPSIGFDAPLPSSTMALLPPSLRGAKRLSDLFQSEEGSRWWYDNGVDLTVEFDLTDNRVGWKLLRDYAARKGIPI